MSLCALVTTPAWATGGAGTAGVGSTSPSPVNSDQSTMITQERMGTTGVSRSRSERQRNNGVTATSTSTSTTTETNTDTGMDTGMSRPSNTGITGDMGGLTDRNDTSGSSRIDPTLDDAGSVEEPGSIPAPGGTTENGNTVTDDSDL